MTRSEKARWDEHYRKSSDRSPGAPSSWVLDRVRSLPAHAIILDLASGRGRHAIALARQGRLVLALDIALDAVRVAAREGAHALVADAGAIPLRDGSMDAILCVNYLDRALFPRLAALLRAGGRLIVETFTVDQRKLGWGPTSAGYLLGAGELARLVSPLAVVESREGLVVDESGERYVARVLAVKAGV